MKKLLSLGLATLLILSCLAGCSSGSKASIYIKDGAYNLTPQQYIDAVNAVIEEQGDSRYSTIPDFVASEEKIEICSFRFTLALTTNDDGYITKFDFDWDAESRDAYNTAPFIIGLTIGSIAPDEAGNAVWAKLDMMDIVSPKYSTEASSNGTVFSYDCYGHGVFNRLIISPEE